MLHGRARECAALEELLAGARSDRSAALVLSGPPGIGKSALLEYAVARAGDFHLIRATGVESEQELPFAGLHQLCHPLLDRLPGLPGPQAEALSVAFGLARGPQPDRFLVGLAVLGLLADTARHRPLLGVVDDVQWIDQASARVLGFVAQRLVEDSVVLLFGLRHGHGSVGLDGVPVLTVDRLTDADAHAVLALAMPTLVDQRVRARIVAEAEGIPLALLELPRWFAGDVSGGLRQPAPAGDVTERLEAGFRRRLAGLPEATRRLVLLAAAEPTGDPALVWRAAARLGLSAADLAPAEADGLLQVDGQVIFRHPLVRPAVYRSTDPVQRRSAHLALAAVTDRDREPDRRAWHLAQGTVVPDEQVAAELERSADRARARGGPAAAAALLGRAAELSPQPADQVRRALDAAAEHVVAGALREAGELLDALEALNALDALDALDTVDVRTVGWRERARARQLRARIAVLSGRGADAAAQLLTAAAELAPVDPVLARRAGLDALWAAVSAGRLGTAPQAPDVAAAALRAPPAGRPPGAADLLLDGLARRFADGYPTGAPILRRALDLARSSEPGADEHPVDHDPVSDGVRWLWVAVELWDDDAWHQLAERFVVQARTRGALGELPLGLNYLAGARLFAGEFEAATALIDEADALAEAMGTVPLRYVALRAAALRGDQDRTQALIDAALAEAAGRGEGLMSTVVEYVTAVLNNALGRYELAEPAAVAATRRQELGSSAWGLAELVEAATRIGHHDLAEDALHRITEQATAAGTPWVTGLQSLCAALLAEPRASERLYRTAIERLGRSRNRVALARAHLLYGEWLRRERRRVEAREQLRRAGAMFAAMGALAFTDRAERELLATGEALGRRAPTDRPALTRQETQVVRLVREGHSNPEIGERLFISPRTVEYHLGNVFRKLGVRSRGQLTAALDRLELP
jgi:DNA-binding CsgD family transcriptional regulator/DNA polymerase III delta prime subunit